MAINDTLATGFMVPNIYRLQRKEGQNYFTLFDIDIQSRSRATQETYPERDPRGALA